MFVAQICACLHSSLLSETGVLCWFKVCTHYLHNFTSLIDLQETINSVRDGNRRIILSRGPTTNLGPWGDHMTIRWFFGLMRWVFWMFTRVEWVVIPSPKYPYVGPCGVDLGWGQVGFQDVATRAWLVLPYTRWSVPRWFMVSWSENRAWKPEIGWLDCHVPHHIGYKLQTD